MNRRRRWIVGGAGVVALILGGGLIILAWWRAAVPAPEAAFRAAIARWAARPFTPYSVESLSTLVERNWP